MVGFKTHLRLLELSLISIIALHCTHHHHLTSKRATNSNNQPADELGSNGPVLVALGCNGNGGLESASALAGTKFHFHNFPHHHHPYHALRLMIIIDLTTIIVLMIISIVLMMIII